MPSNAILSKLNLNHVQHKSDRQTFFIDMWHLATQPQWAYNYVTFVFYL